MSSSLQDDFTWLQEDFERNLKATVSVNVPGMNLPHAVQHLRHVYVVVFERDQE